MPAATNSPPDPAPDRDPPLSSQDVQPRPPVTPLRQVQLQPIGYIRTAYRDPADTPIQTSRNPDEPGRLVVLEQYADGLDGLEWYQSRQYSNKAGRSGFPPPFC